MTLRPLVRRHGLAAAGTLLAVAVNLVVYVAVVGPNQTALTTLETQWQQERETIERAKAYKQALADVDAALAKAAPRQDLPLLITELAGAAKKRGLSIPSVDYQPQRVESKDFEKLVLTFSIAGRYAQVRHFLHDLERFSPFVTIENLTLTRSKKEGTELEVQLKVAAYLKVA